MFERIRAILAEQLLIDENTITLDSDIADDLGADSLDIIEFLNTLEDEYDIVISQDAVKDVRTVGQVIEVLESMV